MSENEEVIESADRKYRAVIRHDYFPAQPDGCWFGTVYQLDHVGRRAQVDILGQDSCVQTDLGATIAELWQDWRDMKDVEDVLRGRENVCRECGEMLRPDPKTTWRTPTMDGCADDDHDPMYDFSDNPVVGFDYIDRDYGALINVITLRDLQHWGFETVEAFLATHPGKDPSAGIMAEWEAWADGDVYYVSIEERVDWQRLDSNGEPAFPADAPASMETWEPDDSISGLYGIEAARSEAQRWIDNYNGEVE